MLTIIIPFVIFAWGIGLIVRAHHDSNKTHLPVERNVWWKVGQITAWFAGATVVMQICILAQIYVTLPGGMAGYQKRYESLVYQLSSGEYENLTDNGKRELFVDIERWNCDLAYRKEMQHDIWIGIYYPDVYDLFSYIYYPGQGGDWV